MTELNYPPVRPRMNTNSYKPKLYGDVICLINGNDIYDAVREDLVHGTIIGIRGPASTYSHSPGDNPELFMQASVFDSEISFGRIILSRDKQYVYGTARDYINEQLLAKVRVSTGELMWVASRVFQMEGFALAFDTKGNIIVGGVTYTGGDDVGLERLWKYDTDGNEIENDNWPIEAKQVYDIAVDSQGNIYVVFVSKWTTLSVNVQKYNPDGSAAWGPGISLAANPIYPAFRVEVDSNDNPFVLTRNYTYEGDAGTALFKLNPANGNIVASAILGNVNRENACGLVIMPDDTIVAANSNGNLSHWSNSLVKDTSGSWSDPPTTFATNLRRGPLNQFYALVNTATRLYTLAGEFVHTINLAPGLIDIVQLNIKVVDLMYQNMKPENFPSYQLDPPEGTNETNIKADGSMCCFLDDQIPRFWWGTSVEHDITEYIEDGSQDILKISGNHASDFIVGLTCRLGDSSESDNDDFYTINDVSESGGSTFIKVGLLIIPASGGTVSMPTYNVGDIFWHDGRWLSNERYKLIMPVGTFRVHTEITAADNVNSVSRGWNFVERLSYAHPCGNENWNQYIGLGGENSGGVDGSGAGNAPKFYTISLVDMADVGGVDYNGNYILKAGPAKFGFFYYYNPITNFRINFQINDQQMDYDPNFKTTQFTRIRAYWHSADMTDIIEVFKWDNNVSDVDSLHPALLLHDASPTDVSNDLGTGGICSLYPSKRDEWDNTTTFPLNQIIAHLGFFYKAKSGQSGNEPPDATYWDKLTGP